MQCGELAENLQVPRRSPHERGKVSLLLRRFLELHLVYVAVSAVEGFFILVGVVGALACPGAITAQSVSTTLPFASG